MGRCVRGRSVRNLYRSVPDLYQRLALACNLRFVSWTLPQIFGWMNHLSFICCVPQFPQPIRLLTLLVTRYSRRDIDARTRCEFTSCRIVGLGMSARSIKFHVSHGRILQMTLFVSKLKDVSHFPKDGAWDWGGPNNPPRSLSKRSCLGLISGHQVGAILRIDMSH
jgi:hypothetical protein